MKVKKLKIICTLIILIIISLNIGTNASETNKNNKDMGETENTKVIEITEEISKNYSICPEFLQAIIFYESSNQEEIVSKWGDIGYMQVNPKWHKERMKKLGVTDLKDGYENILVGCDFLHELFQKYGDAELVLMSYNEGEKDAIVRYESGQISDYAKNIIKLSKELERMHGK